MIAIGSRVRYIREDNAELKATGFYPPIGTHGTVTNIDYYNEAIEVQWDEGTYGNGTWWCGPEDIDEIYNPTTHGGVVAIRIYLKDGHIPMADLVFANKGMVTIEWANVKEREFYAHCINAYTLIYDERPKREFAEWAWEEHK